MEVSSQLVLDVEYWLHTKLNIVLQYQGKFDIFLIYLLKFSTVFFFKMAKGQTQSMGNSHQDR